MEAEVMFHVEGQSDLHHMVVNMAITVDQLMKCVVAEVGQPVAAIQAEWGQLSPSDLFADYFEPDVVYQAVLPKEDDPIPAGTLFADISDCVRQLGISWSGGELLFSRSTGKWDIEEFVEKVVGAVPVLLLVETATGIYGGYAAVAFPSPEEVEEGDEPWEFQADDPSGETFVFALQPEAGRFRMVEPWNAVNWGPTQFSFGENVTIWTDGTMFRDEGEYAVPEWWGFEQGPYLRFEVWRLTA
jgi:hypothetical protein